MQSDTDIQIVKIKGTKPYPTVSEIGVREWILSASTNINAPNLYDSSGNIVNNIFNTSPAIVCDPTKDKIYIAYRTTGTVSNGDKLSQTGLNDIVVACIGTDASLIWTKQVYEYNQLNGNFDNGLTIDIDIYGALYVGSRGSDLNGTPRLVFYRIDPSTGNPLWEYLKVTNRTLLLNYYIATPSEFSAVSTISSAAPYSVPDINISKNNKLYISVNTDNGKQFEIIAVNPTQKYNQTGSGIITNVD
jgi:hypothetical protein